MKEESSPTVDIALPCYNAALWIDRFMESLLACGDSNWRVVARDDGSTDSTLALLKGWRERLGPRFVLLEERSISGNLGVIGSYNAVLSACSAPWVMTADPDDIWLPNRLPLTLRALKAAEAESGAETPIAVCTDAEVVDNELNLVAPSFWRWSHGWPRPNASVAHVAMDNFSLGSTMALNRALLRIALPMPSRAIYQDWWLALAASAFGRLEIVPEVTIRYQRHVANTSTEPFPASPLKALALVLGKSRSPRDRLYGVIRKVAPQAQAFAEIYAERLAPPDLDAVRALGQLQELGLVARRWAVIRHGLWFNNPLWNLGMLALL